MSCWELRSISQQDIAIDRQQHTKMEAVSAVERTPDDEHWMLETCRVNK
jgi:hypothetical protein